MAALPQEVRVGTVVQKFGGSSVGDPGRLRRVAERVAARRATGDQVIVVVSAMGDTTDELLTLARKISADPPRRELDMLLSCGERISMALLSMALQQLGVPAKSFTGSQSGIITDEAHAQARIVEVRPHRILEALAEGQVVIVAGYQGVSRAREVTTLGRGGSDTTAVALAAALGADCEIYSDVDGVYSADPRVVPDAKKLDELSHEEMQTLAACGAKVLNAQAVEFARHKGIEIHAGSTFGGGTGTRVGPDASELRGRARAVAVEREVAIFSARTKPGTLAQVLGLLERRGARGGWLSFFADGAGAGQAWWVSPLSDVHAERALEDELRATCELVRHPDLAIVTCVGAGIAADHGPLRRALQLAHTLEVPVHGIHTAALQLSFVVPAAQSLALAKALHDALVATEVTA